MLHDEMRALREHGVDVLVCALPDAERRELDLADEEDAAREAGLEFVAIPIEDLHIPDVAAVTPALARLAERLRGGTHIVTHCRFGIGRSSLLAASILVLNGMAPDEAWRSISAARGHDVPDTPEQRRWVDALVR